ncbi:MAG: Rpn family recombination-promoting nuclease/putative transposase [Clostridiales bacterium]|nr:Rpn family recombination-promoting nuclease/putative transposase [Clostridiales bacterium]
MNKDNRITAQTIGSAALPQILTNTRDINSKRIFQDPILCAQFLRDNIDIPELKNVRPEDIEDLTERYFVYLGKEFQSDTVKRIRLQNTDGTKPGQFFYLISLIEHKSSVDYNVAMQILKYMLCIWDDYGREQERIHPDITKRNCWGGRTRCRCS